MTPKFQTRSRYLVIFLGKFLFCSHWCVIIADWSADLNQFTESFSSFMVGELEIIQIENCFRAVLSQRRMVSKQLTLISISN